MSFGEVLATMPHGTVVAFRDNELKVVSSKSGGDPSKIYCAIVASTLDINVGAFAFALDRNDGTNEIDEVALITCRRIGHSNNYAVTIGIAPTPGTPVEELLHIDRSIALFHVPVQAPNLGPVVGDPFVSGVIALYRELLRREPDGNVVEQHWRPLSVRYGATLPEQLAGIRAAIIGSAEYKNTH